MADVTIELPKTRLGRPRLPAMGREFEGPAGDAAAADQASSRSANAVATRVKNAGSPVEKGFDARDFSAMPGLSKPEALGLARGDRIGRKFNRCLVGSHGTGETHISVGLGPAACRAGPRARSPAAAELVDRPEAGQKRYAAGRFLGQSEKAHLLTRGAPGYVSTSRAGWGCCSAPSPAATSVAAFR